MNLLFSNNNSVILGGFSMEKRIIQRKYEGHGKREQEVVASSSKRIKGYQTQQVLVQYD